MQLYIFLVEDNHLIKDQLLKLLNSLGASQVIATAETEEEAVSWLSRNEGLWDLVVLDLVLTSGSGFGVLERMESHHREKVIVLTNSATHEHRSRCAAYGASAVFDKTAELPDFLQHCDRFRREDRPDGTRRPI